MSTQLADNINANGVSAKKRFPCVVTLEDFSVDISLLSSRVAPHPRSFCWDEMRVVIERSGVTQCTRWLSPFIALNNFFDFGSKRNISDTNITVGKKASDTVELRWSSINTAGFIVSFRHLDKETGDPFDYGYGRSVHPTNLKYFDSYDNESFECDHAKVCPKLVHPFFLNVECRNLVQSFSFSDEVMEGGLKPTGANYEKFSAYCAKGMSVVSTLFKRAIPKHFTAKTKEEVHSDKYDVDDNKNDRTNHSISDVHSSVGLYVSETTVDPSEAYNSVAGRRRFSLVLRPSKGELSDKKEGVPIVLHFTMVAHFKEVIPVPIRDFHSMVVLLDQVVLDVTVPHKDSDSVTGSGVKFVESYAVGFTSDVSRSTDFTIHTPFVVPHNVRAGEEDKLLLVDFYSLHQKQDEREITESDMKNNPTSFCIVSSGCKVGNKKQIGNRVIMVSRFKTALDGLCKSSYKSQLHFGLMRRYNNGEIEIERCTHPIDLAYILNREHYSDKTRTVDFSCGECMSFRLRRRCFVNPKHHSSELLMPFDYDNTGIDTALFGDNSSSEDKIMFFSRPTECTSSRDNTDRGDNGRNVQTCDRAEKECENEAVGDDAVERERGGGNDYGGQSVIFASEHVTPVTTASVSAARLLVDSGLYAYNSYEVKSYGSLKKVEENEVVESRGNVEAMKLNENGASIPTATENNNNKMGYQFDSNSDFITFEVTQGSAAPDKDSHDVRLPNAVFIKEDATLQSTVSVTPFLCTSDDTLSGLSTEQNTTRKSGLPVIFFE